MLPGRQAAGRQGQRGQALAELAMIVSLMLVMAVSLFDLGRGVSAYLSIIQGARDGARVAMDSTRTDDEVRAAALAAAAPITPSVTIVRNASSATVTLTYDYQPITPVLGVVVSGGTLHMSAKMVSQ